MIEDEYRRSLVDEEADWRAPKPKLRKALQELFNYMAELFAKNMASHVGGSARTRSV